MAILLMRPRPNEHTFVLLTKRGSILDMTIIRTVTSEGKTLKMLTGDRMSMSLNKSKKNDLHL